MADTYLNPGGWLGAWLDFAGANKEVPREYTLALGVGLLGAFLAGGERYTIATGVSPIALTPRVSSILVGESSSGKGLAFQWGMELLDKVNDVMPDDRLLESLSDASTPEFLVNSLATNSWKLFIADEAVIALGCQREYNRNFAENLTSLLDEKQRFAFNFLKRQDLIRRPLLTFLAGSNEVWLGRLLSPELAIGGFPGRFMWWFAPPPTEIEDELPTRSEKEWEEIVAFFKSRAQLQAALSVAKGCAITPAVERYRAWRREHITQERERKRTYGEDDRLGSWRDRWPMWLLRLAMVSAASHGRVQLHLDDIEWGLSALETNAGPYATALGQLEMVGRPDRRDAIKRAIVAIGGVVKATQLLQSKAVRVHFRSAEALTLELNEMVAAGEVRRTVAPNKDFNYILVG